MQHATGIADYRDQRGFDASKTYGLGKLIATVEAIPLAFKPGTAVKQSATNFLLLASVIEQTSRMPYVIQSKTEGGQPSLR